MGLFTKKKKGSVTKSAQQPVDTTIASAKILRKGTVSLLDIIAPSSIEVDFRYIRIGETFYTTLFVVGYPRFVSPSWLEPLVDFDHTLDISMFVYPTQGTNVLSDLRRKIAEMEATI